MKGEKIMICNVGKKDRIARLIVGIVVMGIGFSSGSGWGALGLIPLLTGLAGWCPAYRLFGISSFPTKREGHDDSAFTGPSAA